MSNPNPPDTFVTETPPPNSREPILCYCGAVHQNQIQVGTKVEADTSTRCGPEHVDLLPRGSNIKRSNNMDSQRYIDSQRLAEQDRNRIAPTPDEIRKWMEDEAAGVESRLKDERDSQTSREWIAGKPEYRPSPFAAKMVNEYLESRGLDVTHENLDAAFDHLTSRKLIESNDVDKQVATKVRQSEIMRRAQAIAESNAAAGPHTTEELYSMPLSDLKRLAWERS